MLSLLGTVKWEPTLAVLRCTFFLVNIRVLVNGTYICGIALSFKGSV